MSQFSDALFIGGSGRSGTTIAGKLLSRHQEVILAKPIEIKFLTSGNGLLDLYLNPRVSRSGKVRVAPNANLKRFIKSADDKWWFRKGKKSGVTGLSTGIERAEWDALIADLKVEIDENRFQACQNFFRGYLDIQKREATSHLWIDTTPPNLMRANEIAHLLPGARFLHMIRDGRDVASSVVKEPWGPSKHFEALDWWKERMLLILKETREIESSVHHLWMEDLVENDREASLEKLLKFLNLGPDSKMFDYFRETINPSSAHTGRWRQEVKRASEFDSKYQKILEGLIKEGLKLPTKQT